MPLSSMVQFPFKQRELGTKFNALLVVKNSTPMLNSSGIVVAIVAKVIPFANPNRLTMITSIPFPPALSGLGVFFAQAM